MKLQILNRYIWASIFIIGSAIFVWIEWHSASSGAIGWFLSVSLWSAFCGIGFTVIEWIMWKDK